MVGKTGFHVAGAKPNSREVTPPVGKQPATQKNDAELASVFKSDLTDIRNLITCSICDQLLYEPWTLECGHTYCYSCLCNWFKDKSKKTCPECRNIVKQMPAPAFLVKQMVEIFIKRGELLPSDESIEQHQTKRTEEIADVDKDRNGPKGIFKGMFPAAKRELIFDEGDGVYRCPRCLTEHEGGPTCTTCNLAVEPSYDLSDMDDDFDPEDLENLEVDLDDEFGSGLTGHHADFHFGNIHRHLHAHAHFHHPLHPHHHYHHGYDSEDSESDSELDREEDDDDEDNSLQGFVVADNDDRRPGNQTNERETINISDDDSDEGGAISNRRRRPIRVLSGSSSPSTPPRNSVTSTVASEDAEITLQRAGWSPLDQENESDLERRNHYPPYTSDDENSEGSDTETIGNGASDDDSDRSQTPRFEYSRYGEESSDGEEDNNSDVEGGMDHDGDTEMSVSPSVGQYRGSSVSTDGYGYDTGLEEPHTRSASIASGAYDYGGMSSRGVSNDPENSNHATQNLGEASEIHEVDDDSSDSSIVAPPRRQRRQYPNVVRAQPHYDPRISSIFAEHLANDPHSNLAMLDDQMMHRPQIVETASRAARTSAYRNHQQRRIDPLRSSVTRISSSNRTRLPPQYHRRN